MLGCGMRGNPWLCSGSHLSAPRQPLSSGRENNRKPPSCLCFCFVRHQDGLIAAKCGSQLSWASWGKCKWNEWLHLMHSGFFPQKWRHIGTSVLLGIYSVEPQLSHCIGESKPKVSRTQGHTLVRMDIMATDPWLPESRSTTCDFEEIGGSPTDNLSVPWDFI